MVKSKALLLAILGLSLTGCLKENFSPEIVTIDQEEAAPVKPPCEYNDSIYISIFRGMSGSPRVEIQEHFDDVDVICRFYRSANDLTFNFNSRYGLKALTSGVYDYSDNEYDKLKPFIRRWDGSFGPSPKVISGKLYVEVNNDKSITFTWCDIKFQDDNFVYDSHGGFTFTY
jgi:hypothetical protein